MDEKVPGGREVFINGDTVSSNENSPKREVKTNPTKTAMPGVSKSLPRYGTECDKTELSDSFKFKSSTLDRKHSVRTVNRSIKSLGNLLSRVVSHVSQGSISSSKKQKTPKEGKDAIRNGIDPPANNGPLVLQFTSEHTPGNVGLKNHGNTCFMNAVLQCLSHTELLLEYFITNSYKSDIKRNNKQRSKKFGSKGELTDHLSALFKSLWSCQYTSEISNDFKNVVGKYSNQYKGYSQHDAQEFLLWLLDKIHEDVNIASKHKYKANKSTLGRSDDAIAAETLANQSRCNNSFIYDAFQALYRSSLRCALCRHQSNTFDPFLSVSLPIPQKCQRPVYATVVYGAAQPRQVRIGLLMNVTDAVQDLRYTLATDTKIPQTQLILTEIYYDGFHRTFHDSQFLSDIHETDNIYAIECPTAATPSQKTSTAASATSTAKSTSKDKDKDKEGGSKESTATSTSKDAEDGENNYLPLVLLNKQGLGTHGKRFGGPIMLNVKRDITYSELSAEIYKNVQPMCQTVLQPSHRFQLRVVDGLAGYLTSDVELPLFTPTVDRALSNCITGGGPSHVKLVAEWDQAIKTSEDHVEEHASVKQVKLAHDQPVLGTLDECFQLYTQEEKLGPDDAWYCPSCRKQQTGTTKTLSLWSTPDIFIIHLKRFKQVGLRRTKLNTLITFPVTGLDMGRHLTKRQNASSSASSSSVSASSSSLATNTGGGAVSTKLAPPTWSPWRPNRQSLHMGRPEDNLYDLYAVCNHYGNMQGGHYTAFCKNSLTKKWYTFDDLKVTEMSENTVVTRAAYLLFYRRRTAATTHMQSPQHWLHQLSNIGYVHRAPRVPISKSHDDLLDDHNSDSETEHSSQFVRCVNPYATMRLSRPSPSSPDKPLVPLGNKGRLPGSVSMGQLDAAKPPPHPTSSSSSSPASRTVDIPPSNRVRHASYQSSSSPSPHHRPHPPHHPHQHPASAPEFTPPLERVKPWAKPPIQLAPPPPAPSSAGKVIVNGTPAAATAASTQTPPSSGSNTLPRSKAKKVVPAEAHAPLSPSESSDTSGAGSGSSQHSSPAHNGSKSAAVSASSSTEWNRTIYMQESCV